jgi:hypothetical protein
MSVEAAAFRRIDLLVRRGMMQNRATRRKWMGHKGRDFEVQSDRGNLLAEVSDEELEAAAGSTTYAAMTFPSAPTVSVVVLCCGNEYPSENTPHKSTA